MFIINHIKSVLAGFGLCLLALNASAYPLMTFNGSMSYVAESGLFDVTSTLTQTQGISPAPLLAGSSLKISALLDTSSVLSNSLGTSAGFTGATSGSGPLLSVIDGDGSTTLLQGELTGLVMGGANDSNTGSLYAQFNPTSGTLLNEFAVGAQLFSLQLNLTTKFGSTMFASGFSGNVDGKLYAPAVSVPEPGVLVLFILGLGMLVMVTRKKPGQKFSHPVS